MLKLKNKYSRFFVNTVLFFLTIYASDQILGGMLRNYYFSTKSGDYYRTTYSMDSTKAEIIILGSSRASHHYIPSMIEDSIKMTCYNTGRDGNFLLFNYAVFKSIIKRYSPKVLVLDINTGELIKEHDNYEALSTLLPYYFYKPELKNIIELRSPFEKYKMLSAVYPFNSTIVTLAKSHLGSYNDTKNKGYLPLFGTSLSVSQKPNNQITQKKNEIIDTLKMNVIDSIAFICKEKKILFFVVQSPRFSEVKQTKLDSAIENILKIHKAQYWNFVNDSLYMSSPTLFKDAAHLNNDGAKIFTEMIVSKFKQME